MAASIVTGARAALVFHGEARLVRVWAHGSSVLPNGPVLDEDEDSDFYGPSGGVVLVLFEGAASFCTYSGPRDAEGRRCLSHVYLGWDTPDHLLAELAETTAFTFADLCGLRDSLLESVVAEALALA